MTAPDSDASGPLAIICAGGAMPFAVADAALANGRRVVLFPIKGIADPARVARYAHHWIGLGQFGAFLRHARAEGCREVMFIGALKRPPLWSVRFDLTALRKLPAVISAYRGGDDRLLRGLGAIFEQEGFRIVGAEEVAPQVLMPEGVLTARSPTAGDRADIADALQALKAIGRLDIAQAIVVADGDVLAVEDARGTDVMLAQFAKLRASQRSRQKDRQGVLVKAPKPMQDRRHDLPAIGPQTVASVAQAGLSGIAVVAGGGVVAELERMVQAANRANIFIFGVKDAP